MRQTTKIIIILSATAALGLTACANEETAPPVTQTAVKVDLPSLAPPRCDDGIPHVNAPKEFSQFAFLIGDYEVSAHAWKNEAWTPPRPGPTARWNGWYGLGGMAIYDEWYGTDPGFDNDSGRGVNVRFYDTNSSEWKMMWVHTKAAKVQDLRAEMRDRKLTMWQVYPERPNFLAEFNVIDADHWNRISFLKDEEGNWTKQFKLAATRIPCP